MCRYARTASALLGTSVGDSASCALGASDPALRDVRSCALCGAISCSVQGSAWPVDPDVATAEFGRFMIGKTISFEADVENIRLPVEQSYVN